LTENHNFENRRHHEHYEHHEHHEHHGMPPWARGMSADERGGYGRPPFRGRRGRGRGFSGGEPGFFGRGQKAGRGDVRAAILTLLAEQPMHGYQIIRELSERSGGVWSPSPGSIYPTLQLLEEEGLIRGQESDGKKVFTLTEAGQATLATRAPGRRAPWDEVGADVDSALIDLRDAIGQVAVAARQIAHAGTGAQVAGAKKLLIETRRGLYRILAEDPSVADVAEDTPTAEVVDDTPAGEGTL
jgi:DNA-binding PadR family transcriptional regulator